MTRYTWFQRNAWLTFVFLNCYSKFTYYRLFLAIVKNTHLFNPIVSSQTSATLHSYRQTDWIERVHELTDWFNFKIQFKDMLHINQKQQLNCPTAKLHLILQSIKYIMDNNSLIGGQFNSNYWDFESYQPDLNVT